MTSSSVSPLAPGTPSVLVGATAAPGPITTSPSPARRRPRVARPAIRPPSPGPAATSVSAPPAYPHDSSPAAVGLCSPVVGDRAVPHAVPTSSARASRRSGAGRSRPGSGRGRRGRRSGSAARPAAARPGQPGRARGPAGAACPRRRSVRRRVVRDLVVADEVRVDDGAAGAHVADEGRDDDVAGQHGREGAQQGVDAAPVHPRSDVTSCRWAAAWCISRTTSTRTPIRVRIVV